MRQKQSSRGLFMTGQIQLMQQQSWQAFFPVFFKQYWSAGTDVHVSTFNLGTANSLASVIVALLAPVLGSIADQWGKRKDFFFFLRLWVW